MSENTSKELCNHFELMRRNDDEWSCKSCFKKFRLGHEPPAAQCICGTIKNTVMGCPVCDPIAPTPPEIARLRAALEHLSLYIAANGDDWVQRTAREYLAGSAPPPRVGRTNEDYAIEHGRYLATAAEQFLSAVEKLDEAEIAKSEAVTSEEDDGAEIALRDASESRSDHWQALRSAIYEFRKRADRATATKTEGL